MTNVAKRRSSRLVETSTDLSSGAIENDFENKQSTPLWAKSDNDEIGLVYSNLSQAEPLKHTSTNHKSVLQDITNKLENNLPDVNIENSYDSGIEDSENLNSSCDDMDLLGPKRKRKPKVFEGFHTGDELNNAFKTKGKGKTDLAKGDTVQPIVDKENAVFPKHVLSDTLEDSVIDKDESCVSAELSSNEKDSSLILNGKRKRAIKTVETIVTESKELKKKTDVTVPTISKKTVMKIKNEDNVTTAFSEDTKNFKKTFRDDKNHIIQQTEIKEESDDNFCFICEETNGEFLACTGLCSNFFHADCLGLNTIPVKFVCDECSSGVHTCFVCHKPGDTIKCSLESCGKYYHTECVEKYECTKFGNKAKDKFTCPMHTCKYCNKDKTLKLTNSKKTVRCIR